MEVLLLAFRLILAGIFGIAAAAKFADLGGSRKAMSDFGMPSSLTRPISIALPIAEVLISVFLLFLQSSWFAALAGAVLLTVFIAGMANQMIKGNAPDCHCFGQLHSEPVSYKSLIRNLVFLAPAVVLLVSGPSGQGISATSMNIEVTQLFAVLIGTAMLAAAVFYLRKISAQQTQILRRIELLELISRDGEHIQRQDAGDPRDGLPIGAPLPDFALPMIDGGIFSRLELLQAAKPTIMFFVSPTCSPCKALAANFDEWETELGGRVNFVFVSSGEADDNRNKFGSGTSRTVLLQKEREFAEAVHAKWTPTALFTDTHGKIASHVATGDMAIIELIDRVRASDLSQEYLHFTSAGSNGIASKAELGSVVPSFSVNAINGENVSSEGLHGKSTLITFWSPTCPHCVKIIDEIKEWDLAKRPDEPALVLFSDGDPEVHRAIGLRSPIILDKDFALAATLGMYGTPSAILVNEEGKFASEIAIGAPNIWALIGRN
ncbi:MAG: MauE/DoxX family redox-associated membrane protein [Acidobacteriota bacterium]